MTNRKTVDSLEEEFLRLIEDKTTWGRNELKLLFSKAVSNHFIALSDKKNRLDGTVLKKKKVTVTENTVLKSRRLRGRDEKRSR